MSYMSLFEKKAKFSIAISILNKTRHWLQERPNTNLTDKDRDILTESLDLDTKEQFAKAVLYSLQGYRDKQKSVVVQLESAINSALELKSKNPEEKEVYSKSLRKAFSTTDCKDLGDDTKQHATDLLTKAIHIIGHQAESQSNRIITAKTL